jgi:hypothetical protein
VRRPRRVYRPPKAGRTLLGRFVFFFAFFCLPWRSTGSVGANPGFFRAFATASKPDASLISVGSLYAVPMNEPDGKPERVAGRDVDDRVVGPG